MSPFMSPFRAVNARNGTQIMKKGQQAVSAIVCLKLHGHKSTGCRTCKYPGFQCTWLLDRSLLVPGTER